MTQSTLNQGIEAFNRAECFQVWYEGVPFEQLPQTLKRPSFRQCLFLMSLVSGLYLPLLRYEVTFPFEDQSRNQYLLKPKKRFYQSLSPDEIQELIEILKPLPSQIQWYRQFPTIAGYFQLEASFKVVLRYFSIPKEKAFFDRLKATVPTSEWEAYEAEQVAQQLAQEQQEQLLRWSQRQAQKLQRQLQPLEVEDFILARGLMRLKKTYPASVRWIKEDTRKNLQAKYYESLCWLQVLNPSFQFPKGLHSDQWLHYLTEVEAQTWFEQLNHLIEPLQASAMITKQRPITVDYVSTLALSSEWMALFHELSQVFPYFRELGTCERLLKQDGGIVPLTHLTASKNPLEGRWQQFQRALHLEQPMNTTETLSQRFILILLAQTVLQQQLKEHGTLSELSSLLQQQASECPLLQTLSEVELKALADTLQPVVQEDFQSYQRQQTLLKEMEQLLETLPKAPVTIHELTEFNG